jgi:hypothetical protein
VDFFFFLLRVDCHGTYTERRERRERRERGGGIGEREGGERREEGEGRGEEGVVLMMLVIIDTDRGWISFFSFAC